MPDYDFWKERWVNNKIGFHQEKPHSSLIEFADVFKGHNKVLVPLCGKSLDMLFLRDLGLEVIGVEFSELAVSDFKHENNLSMTVEKEKHFSVHKTEGLTIYQGDFFHLSEKEWKGATACYDRASMVAFDRNERKKYAELLIKSDVKMILSVIFNCGSVEMGEMGPPYSVMEDEVKALYGKDFQLKKLTEHDFPLREAIKERGATYEKEVTWYMSRGE
jgi:thiopurine S-methyltransferase